jgi:hypothetical protein
MARAVWIVRWRGVEQKCAGLQDVLNRWAQLDARGITAEVLEVTGSSSERRVSLVDTQQFTSTSDCAARASLPLAQHPRFHLGSI